MDDRILRDHTEGYSEDIRVSLRRMLAGVNLPRLGTQRWGSLGQPGP